MSIEHHLKQMPSIGDVDDAVSAEIDEEYADCGFEYDSPKSSVEEPGHHNDEGIPEYDDFDYNDDEQEEEEDSNHEDDAPIADYDSINSSYISQDKVGTPIDSVNLESDNSTKSNPARSYVESNKEKVLYSSDGNNLRFFFNPFFFSPSEECLKTAIHRLVYEHLCYGGSCKNLQNGVIELYYNPVMQSNEDLERTAKMIISIIHSGRIPYDQK